ncbi:hypothetical protein DXG01_006129 [Tephrocybe rancida]|nr:hypothetical protein DXG01_006129 [Tephrocybe rancida]
MLPVLVRNGGGGGGGNCNGGGGRGAGGGGGGGPGAARDAAAFREPIPYVEEWTLNCKINTSTLPTWDGMDETLIQYLGDMQKVAWMGPKVREALAQVAPQKWMGRASNWWDALSPEVKTSLSVNWDVMLLAIRHYFMNAEWIKGRTAEFERMTFWQSRFAHEMSVDYLQRRIKSHVYLYPEDEDGPTMVHHVLLLIPVGWTSHLNSIDCPDILELQAKASQLGVSLVSLWEMMEASRQREKYKDYSSETSRPRHNGKFHDQLRTRTAHAVEEVIKEETSEEEESSEEEEHEVHAVRGQTHGTRSSAAKNRPPWPAGKTINSYAFACRDDVTSLKAPNAMLVESKVSPSAYDTESSEIMSKTNALLDVPDKLDEEDLLKEVFTMDERSLSMPVASSWIIATLNNKSKLNQERKEKGKRPSLRIPHFLNVSDDLRPELMDTKDLEWMLAQAMIGSLEAMPMQARLDSGADITLMSEEYLETLAEAPAIKEGIHMKLYHLTRHAKVLGYVKIPMYAATTDSKIVSFELEAYVMRDMQVPLLLGEDFQTMYELGVNQFAMGHCEIRLCRTDCVIPASSAQAVDLGEKAKSRLDDSPLPVVMDEDILLQASLVHNEKGEVVGYLVDPGTVCNQPKDEDLPKYVASTEALKTVVEGTLRAQDLINGYVWDPSTEEDCLQEDENWGPKAAAVLEDPMVGEVENLVNLGLDVPDDI